MKDRGVWLVRLDANTLGVLDVKTSTELLRIEFCAHWRDLKTKKQLDLLQAVVALYDEREN